MLDSFIWSLTKPHYYRIKYKLLGYYKYDGMDADYTNELLKTVDFAKQTLHELSACMVSTLNTNKFTVQYLF